MFKVWLKNVVPVVDAKGNTDPDAPTLDVEFLIYISP